MEGSTKGREKRTFDGSRSEVLGRRWNRECSDVRKMAGLNRETGPRFRKGGSGTFFTTMRRHILRSYLRDFGIMTDPRVIPATLLS